MACAPSTRVAVGPSTPMVSLGGALPEPSASAVMTYAPAATAPRSIPTGHRDAPGRAPGAGLRLPGHASEWSRGSPRPPPSSGRRRLVPLEAAVWAAWTAYGAVREDRQEDAGRAELAGRNRVGMVACSGPPMEGRAESATPHRVPGPAAPHGG